MSVTRKGWARQQLLVAFSLYCQMPFGKLHSRNPEIIKFAEHIGRTPSALAMKLTNIASLGPATTSTERKGLKKLQKQIEICGKRCKTIEKNLFWKLRKL